MADFFELQDKARAKTRTLVFYFLIAVILIVVAINFAIWFAANMGGFTEVTISEWPSHHYSWITTAVVLAVIFITSGIQTARLGGGGLAVAKMVGARRVTQNTKDKYERRLLNITEEMSIASGMPMPKVFVMDNESGINAFVAGLKPSETVLVVTEGTLKKLSRDELQGVIGHEFSHIFNSDMTTNVRLMGALAGILVIGQLGYMLMRIMGHSRHGMGYSSRSSRDSSNSGVNIIFVIVILGAALFAIGYIGLFFGRLIKASISRQREYLADASSVQFTRDADGIANALAHIQIDSNRGLLRNSHAEDMSHMCFDTPVALSFKGWLATHPPLPDRIKAIRPNFSLADYRPKPNLDADFIDTRRSSSTTSHSPFSSGFVETNAIASDTAEYQTPNETSTIEIIEHIGNPSPKNLEVANTILYQIPDDLLQQSSSNGIKAQLVAYSLLIHAEPEDKHEINNILEKQLPQEYFKLLIQWQQQLLPLSGWIRLPLLNHIIPVLQQCSDNELKLFFDTLLQIIKNNRHVNLPEYILYALLKLRLQPSKSQTSIPSLVEVKAEIGLLFSLVIQAAYTDPVNASEEYQSVMSRFAIGIFPGMYQQRFNAVITHKAFLQLARLSPFLKRTIITALGDTINNSGTVSLDEYELLRAICDYLDCPLPPLDIT